MARVAVQEKPAGLNLSAEEFDVLRAYVEMVAGKLHLRDWAFGIAREGAGPEHAAYVSRRFGQREATVWFSSDFRSRDPGEQRDTVVHEVMHVHLDPMMQVIRNDLRESRCLTPREYDLLHATMMREVEEANDRICRAFAEFLPLIEWPETANGGGTP